jgi:hypothetical protein
MTSERAGEDAGREQAAAAAEPAREPGARHQHERREHGEPGDDAVPELDVRVVGLRQRVADAAAGRPVRAAEPGAGQAHRRARADDQDEHRRGADRDPLEGALGDREAARRTGGGRLHRLPL